MKEKKMMKNVFYAHFEQDILRARRLQLNDCVCLYGGTKHETQICILLKSLSSVLINFFVVVIFFWVENRNKEWIFIVNNLFYSHHTIYKHCQLRDVDFYFAKYHPSSSPRRHTNLKFLIFAVSISHFQSILKSKWAENRRNNFAQCTPFTWRFVHTMQWRFHALKMSHFCAFAELIFFLFRFEKHRKMSALLKKSEIFNYCGDNDWDCWYRKRNSKVNEFDWKCQFLKISLLN